MQTNKSLILRCCPADMTSKNGFVWPLEGPVSCPDWEPTTECGNGLHGWLNGKGDYSVGVYYNKPDAKWFVVEVDNDCIVELSGKVKFKEGNVIFVGTKEQAAECILKNSPEAEAKGIIGLMQVTTEGGSLLGAALSTLTGGDRSTLTGGDRSTLTGGNYSTLTGGNYSTLTGGYDSTLTGGDDSTLTGGDDSTLTSGDRSTLTGGDRSTLTGGNYSTLTGGDRSTLTGGYDSELRFEFWDYVANRKRTKVVSVGEDGIEANVAYKLDSNNQVVKVS